jgi:hypothetical protein
MTEVAGEWRKRVSVLVDEISNIVRVPRSPKSRTDLILSQLAKKRLDQVELEGRSRSVLKCLQRKAAQHARLQSWFKDHTTGLTHVVNIDPYLRKEKGPLIKMIREMDQEVSLGLARIEQNVRELLQIVSAHDISSRCN